MFERFTDRARRSVVLAQEESRRLNHNYIGTEHILLGLLTEGEGVAARALEALGVSVQAARARVEEIIGRGDKAPEAHIPFTPRAKKVLELSLREALQLGHNYIGTEHVLLGLVREGEGVAAQVLVELGADLSRVREQVVQVLSTDPGAQRAERSGAETSLSSFYLHGPGPVMGMGTVPPGLVPELRQVIALGPGHTADLPDGTRLIPICLEVWSHWLELRYALTGSPEGAARPALLQDWTLTDNEGRTYACTTCTASESAPLTVGVHRYLPPPPPGTTRLTFTAPDNGPTIEIPLEPPATDTADTADG